MKSFSYQCLHPPTRFTTSNGICAMSLNLQQCTPLNIQQWSHVAQLRLVIGVCIMLVCISADAAMISCFSSSVMPFLHACSMVRIDSLILSIALLVFSDIYFPFGLLVENNCSMQVLPFLVLFQESYTCFCFVCLLRNRTLHNNNNHPYL